MRDLLPTSSDPKSKGLIGHQWLELDPNRTSGIEPLLNSDKGYIVGRLGNELLRFNTDAHFLTVAPARAGKGTGLVIPNLLDHPGSTFVIDIRGETVAKTADIRRLQGHQVIVIDPFDITKGTWGRDSYNPLDRISRDPNGRWTDDQIIRLTSALMFDPTGRMSKEPIWDNATKNLISGLITLCVRYWEPRRHNLIELLDVLNFTSLELERLVIDIKSIIENDEQGKKDRQLKSLLKVLTESKNTTKITDNALVQAQTLLTWAGNKSFEGIIEDSTFTFDDMQKRKMTIYLVIPEEFINNCAIWIRLMIESAVFSLEDIYSSRDTSTHELNQEERVLFLLDELPAFGQLDIISSGIATLGGRGVNFWLFIQNLAQLEAIYGKDNMRVIIGNMACLQWFESNELEELEYFTRLIGEEFFDVQSVTINEAKTEGVSDSKGQSHTISNSESFSKTLGTADSFTEGTSVNWSNGVSKSKTRSKSTTQNESTNYGSSSGNTKGFNEGTGESFSRNWLFGTKADRQYNENKGISQSGTWSTNSGTSKGSSTGKTLSVGQTISNTHGRSNSQSKTTSLNQSNTEGFQSGRSDTETNSRTTSESRSTSRGVTVKQERMKIETVRSVRAKISGKNQLLQIRGFHPFFCPRMSYFVKFTDVDRYMFPDMASLADRNALRTIANRSELTSSFLPNLSMFDQYKTVIKRLKYALIEIESESKSEGFTPFTMLEGKNIRTSFNPFITINKCIEILDSSFSDSLVNDIKNIDSIIASLYKAYDEISVSALGIITLIKSTNNNLIDSNLDAHIVDNIKALKVLALSTTEIDIKSICNYHKLPLAELRRNQGDKNLSINDLVWLVKVYSPVIINYINLIEDSLLRVESRIHEYEKKRLFFFDFFRNIVNHLDAAIALAREKEDSLREFFFKSLSKNNISPIRSYGLALTKC